MRVKCVIIITTIFISCQFTSFKAFAQINSLYYEYSQGILGRWYVFAIVKNDTIIVEYLSEISAQVATANSDTMFRSEDSLYIGNSGKARIKTGYIHFERQIVTDKKIKIKRYQLKPADEAVIKKWHIRHNKLIEDKLYNRYFLKRQQIPNKTESIKTLDSAYSKLIEKLDILDNEDFLKEAIKFEGTYLK